MAGDALLGNGITDTTLRLTEVPIRREYKPNLTPALVKDNTLLDFSQQQGRKFSDVLNDYSGIYFKNYGVGQLSSISLNGSSAAQTNILWNGIKLNSPTTGQVDLSLFDLEGGDRLSIYTTGQNHSGVGANGLGGTIALDNVLHLDNGQHIRSFDVVRIGSFGERAISSSNIYGIGGFKGATKLALLGADNDFPFINDTKIGAPVMRETNARTQQLSLTQQLQYSFKKPYTIGADLWIT
jgi:iron complex outermembrane receptor protein